MNEIPAAADGRRFRPADRIAPGDGATIKRCKKPLQLINLFCHFIPVIGQLVLSRGSTARCGTVTGQLFNVRPGAEHIDRGANYREPRRECSDFFHKPQGQRVCEYARLRRAMAKPGGEAKPGGGASFRHRSTPRLRMKDSGMARGKAPIARTKASRRRARRHEAISIRPENRC